MVKIIPKSNGYIEKVVSEESIVPSQTFKILGNKIAGIIDNQEALCQAIDLILQTERFEYEILGGDYGVELDDLFSANRELFDARLKMRIEEAVLSDARIKSMNEFKVSREKNNVIVDMVLGSVYGEISYERKI